MFSKIGDFIRPLLFKTDAAQAYDQKKGGQGGRKKEGGEDSGGFGEDDVALFSTEAIRGLLKQENSYEADAPLASLDLLERHGITSIPVRQGQSILSAIEAATALLSGK